MNPRQLSKIAGISYLIIFCTAVYGNFFVLEALLNAPGATVAEQGIQVRLGAMAFLIAAVFDVVVAWALYELYRGHWLSRLSTYFRIMHAAIMGIAVYALMATLSQTTDAAILNSVATFNTLWLIGLFFFGLHLLMLAAITRRTVPIIPYMLGLAGFMYVVDTTAHFVLSNYDLYADLFLTLVAVPAVLGEMSFTVWLLSKGGKNVTT